MLARALPATRVEIEGYVAVPVRIVAKVFVDVARYEKTDVIAASLATLVATFSLERRALGQPLYVAEILAALETVESVSSAVIVDFAPARGRARTGPRGDDRRRPRRDLPRRGAGRASVENAADVAVTAEAAA